MRATLKVRTGFPSGDVGSAPCRHNEELTITEVRGVEYAAGISRDFFPDCDVGRQSVVLRRESGPARQEAFEKCAGRVWDRRPTFDQPPLSGNLRQTGVAQK
jgi:hypothetical protein